MLGKGQALSHPQEFQAHTHHPVHSGQQIGSLTSIAAITYQEDLLLILDKTNANITVYQRTEYGDILAEAIANQNAQLYDDAIEDWTEILKRNSNFDAAYIGIGNALYRGGKYEESLAYYRAAYDTSNYSKSYQEIRKEWISKWIITIPLGIGVLVGAWMFVSRYAKKVNARAAVSGGKRTFKEELLYSFHTMFHPFDGYWDLKHEKRGSIRASVIFLIITVVAFYYSGIGKGYYYNPKNITSTINKLDIEISIQPTFIV